MNFSVEITLKLRQEGEEIITQLSVRDNYIYLGPEEGSSALITKRISVGMQSNRLRELKFMVGREAVRKSDGSGCGLP